MHMDQVAAITVAVFLIGVIYQAGRLSVRVDSLEKWRDDVTEDIKAIRSAVDRRVNDYRA